MSRCEWLSDTPKEKHEQHFFHAQLSSPLGVFAEAQDILQPHSNRSCRVRLSFNIFLSCPSLKTRCYPLIITRCSCPSLLSHPHVHDTGSLSWTFAGLGKASDGAFFWLLPAVCCRGWKDLTGSQSLMPAELSTEGSGGWKLCDTEEAWVRLRDKIDIFNIPSINLGQCHIMHFYSSAGTRAPVRQNEVYAVITAQWTALASNLSLSELSFSIPPSPLQQWS